MLPKAGFGTDLADVTADGQNAILDFRSLTRQSERRLFEKNVMNAIGALVKATEWNKSKSAIFCVLSDFYFDARISVHMNQKLSTIQLMAKPMSLDSLYWKIVELPDNASEPLSFRTWGAFTCSGLPVAEIAIDDEQLSAEDVARQAFELTVLESEKAIDRLKSKQFSEAIAEHPNQRERGAYAISYVVALIDEDLIELARESASAYASGSQNSVMKHTHRGVDFHSLAVRWIDTRIALP